MVPVHIGIIMDGNGRWAQKKGLPRILGHQAGLKAVRRAVKAADKSGVKYLTLYSFSTENWKRPKAEVNFLFSLMEERLRKEGAQLHRKNVRVKFIGNRQELPENLQSITSEVEDLTRKNTGLTLTFAINYGGRQEILEAIKAILKTRPPAGKITEDYFRKSLQTRDLPDPDLIIRTAGEKRLSNFLTWEASYAEFYFTDTLWPDFKGQDLRKAILEYQHRKRKFGGL
jgi:undecaprenyl diphosphate synthase